MKEKNDNITKFQHARKNQQSQNESIIRKIMRVRQREIDRESDRHHDIITTLLTVQLDTRSQIALEMRLQFVTNQNMHIISVTAC